MVPFHQAATRATRTFHPSRPCRKCGEGFGKPFLSIFALSPLGGASSLREPELTPSHFSAPSLIVSFNTPAGGLQPCLPPSSSGPLVLSYGMVPPGSSVGSGYVRLLVYWRETAVSVERNAPTHHLDIRYVYNLPMLYLRLSLSVKHSTS